MLCPHPRHSRAATIGLLCDGSSNFLLIGGFVPDLVSHLCVVEDDGEARRVAPPVKLNTLRRLPFHGLGARLCLCLRLFLVPPFQVRCRKASWTFPLASSAMINLPTCAVRAARSLFSAGWMARYFAGLPTAEAVLLMVKVRLTRGWSTLKGPRKDHVSKVPSR